MSKFPIGATWEIIDKRQVFQGRTAHIKLIARHKTFEVWTASWYYTVDHSSLWNASDWFTSYNMARNWLTLHGRAKRIK